MMKRLTLAVCAFGAGVLVASGVDAIRTGGPAWTVGAAFAGAAFWTAAAAMEIWWWRQKLRRM